jgi:phosphate uptake regulator
MKRKINRVGTNTLTVSLPSKWAKTYGVKPGDEVDVVEEGKILIVGSEKKRFLGKKKIEISTTKEFVKRLLYVPYVLGYDEIEVTFKEQKVMEKIEKTVEIMSGFEIIDQRPGFCLVQNIAKEEDTKFKEVFRRLIFLVQTMGNELEKGLKEDQEKLNSLPSMRRMANKLTLFCGRILHLKGHKDQDRTIRYYLIVNLLEKIAIHLRDLGEHFKDRKSKYTQNEIKWIKYVNEQIKTFVKLFFDDKKMDQLAEFRRNTWEVAHYPENNLLKGIKTKEDFYVVARLVMILDKLDQIMQEVH